MVKVSEVVFLLILTVSMLVVRVTFGSHIVGGELRMEPTGSSNSYSVTLIQFWDENHLVIPTNNVSGNRDWQVTLYIYKKQNNQLMDSVTLQYRSSQTVAYQNQTCAVARSMKTQQGIYTGTVQLPSVRYDHADGYYMVWERCCRNADIDNIQEPGDSGMAFYLEFPPTNIKNASPEFQFPNGQYICVNKRFTMNMAAIDKDGDQLRYTLVTPLRGNTLADVKMAVGNSSPKTGYPLVSWATGISLNNVIPGPVPLEINANTGVLTVVAGRTGLYVFAVQCEEFRNGKKIGVVRRDFQLLVIDCNLDTPEPPVITMQSQPIRSVKFCPEKPIMLETLHSPDWAYQWQFNGMNIAGATHEQLMVSDTGRYTVIKSFKKICGGDTASAPIQVGYADRLKAKITPDESVICIGEFTNLVANGGSPILPNYTYVWRDGESQLVENETSISVEKSSWYYLSITDDLLGCIEKDSVRITIDSLSVDLPPTVSMLKGNAVTVTAQVLPDRPDYTYQWDPVDDGFRSDPRKPTAVLFPLMESSYTVQAVSPNGCTGEATVIVHVLDRLHIPTAFTPNQDGINDTFEIFNPKNEILEVRIFNRWGAVIFQSTGYEHPWDGTFRNETVPAGSYPYLVRTPFGEYRGSVLILR
jgi:gliding motility-associated-like protein